MVCENYFSTPQLEAPLPLCGCRRHPQCKPRSTFKLEMCQPMAPVLPVSERKLRHVAVWWAAPRQATACQYLVTVVPGAKHKGTWKLIPMSAFQGESGHHNSAASYRLGVRAASTGAATFWPRSEEHFLRLANIQTSRFDRFVSTHGPKRTSKLCSACPLLGVKRTWRTYEYTPWSNSRQHPSRQPRRHRSAGRGHFQKCERPEAARPRGEPLIDPSIFS